MNETDIIFLIIIIPALYSAYLWYEIIRLGTEFRAYRLMNQKKIIELEIEIEKLNEIPNYRNRSCKK